MSTDADRPSVLVVDDERAVADVFAEQLSPRYDVEAVYSGAEAVDVLDAAPDAVLLDRRMPGLSGDEVLEAIQEHDADPPVAMVTAVDPDVDIIDMPFDDYLVKPVDAEQLLETVRGLLDVEDLHETKEALSSLKIKRNVLEIEKSPRELEASERFQRLEDRIEELEAELAAEESASEAS